jgi:hypothetical protein
VGSVRPSFHSLFILRKMLKSVFEQISIDQLIKRERCCFPDAYTRSYASADQPRTTPSSWYSTSVNSTISQLDITASDVTSVRYAYVIIGSLAFVAVFLFVVAYLRDRFKAKVNPLGDSSLLLSSRGSTSSKSAECTFDDQSPDHLPSCSESRSEHTPTDEDHKQRDR